MIKLPSYEWFMGQIPFHGKGNVYSGSFGCDPSLGNIDENTFRYTVLIDKDEDENFILKAYCYAGINAFDATDKTDMTENTFAASAEGILEAQQWIIDRKNEFYKNKGIGDESCD